MATSIVIKGVTFSVSAVNSLAAAVPIIILGIGNKQSADEIVQALEPAALPIIEQIANLLFPGAGTVIEIVAALASQAKPWTAEDQQRWWDRANGNQ